MTLKYTWAFLFFCSQIMVACSDLGGSQAPTASSGKYCFGPYCLGPNIDEFVSGLHEKEDYYPLQHGGIYVTEPVYLSGAPFLIEYKVSESGDFKILSASSGLENGKPSDCLKQYQVLVDDFSREHQNIGSVLSPNLKKWQKNRKTPGKIPYILTAASEDSHDATHAHTVAVYPEDDLEFVVELSIWHSEADLSRLARCSFSVFYQSDSHQ